MTFASFSQPRLGCPLSPGCNGCMLCGRVFTHVPVHDSTTACADSSPHDAHGLQGQQPASQGSAASKTSSNTGPSSSGSSISSSNSSIHHPGSYAWHHYDTIDKCSGPALSWNEVTRAVDAARDSLARKQKHAGGKPASLTLEFDLRGVHFDLRSGSSNTPGPHRDTLLLPPGLTLRLANGSISSDSLSLVAGPGSCLQLCNMRLIRGRPERSGVVTVRGEGAKATLEHCTICVSTSTMSKLISAMRLVQTHQMARPS
jgi:hypothetical protein